LNARKIIITPEKFLEKSKQDQFHQISPKQRNQNLRQNYTPENFKTVISSNSPDEKLFLNYFEIKISTVRLAFKQLVSIGLLNKHSKPNYGNEEYAYFLTDEGENFIRISESFKQFSEYKKESVTKEIFNTLIDSKLKQQQAALQKDSKIYRSMNILFSALAIIISLISLFRT
jgi:predicted transcriptional regulator